MSQYKDPFLANKIAREKHILEANCKMESKLRNYRNFIQPELHDKGNWGRHIEDYHLPPSSNILSQYDGGQHKFEEELEKQKNSLVSSTGDIRRKLRDEYHNESLKYREVVASDYNTFCNEEKRLNRLKQAHYHDQLASQIAEREAINKNAFRMDRREKNFQNAEMHAWKNNDKTIHTHAIPGWGYNSRYKHLYKQNLNVSMSQPELYQNNLRTNEDQNALQYSNNPMTRRISQKGIGLYSPNQGPMDNMQASA